MQHGGGEDACGRKSILENREFHGGRIWGVGVRSAYSQDVCGREYKTRILVLVAKRNDRVSLGVYQ